MKRFSFAVCLLVTLLLPAIARAATPWDKPEAALVVYATSYGLRSMWGDGSHDAPLTFPGTQADLMPAVSPNGHYVAFSSTRPVDRFNIYLLDLKNGNLRRLTHALADWSPCWVGNGQLVYMSVTSPYIGAKLVKININQPKPTPERLTKSEDTIWESNPTSDGRVVYYERGVGLRPYSIWAINIANGSEWLVVEGTTVDVRDPVISPDGKVLAYIPYWDEDVNHPQIYTARVDGSLPAIGEPIGIMPSYYPCWHPSGKGLFYTANLAGGVQIYYIPLPLDGTAPILLTYPFGYSWDASATWNR